VTDGQLVVLGAVLEGGGHVLLARDLLSAAQRKAKLTRRNQLVQVPGLVSEGSIGVPQVTTTEEQAPPPEPTLPERVEAVEARVEEVAASVDRLEEKMKDDLRAVSDQAARLVAEARREVFDSYQEARGLLGEELWGASMAALGGHRAFRRRTRAQYAGQRLVHLTGRSLFLFRRIRVDGR
jgi:hypothetical protein